MCRQLVALLCSFLCWAKFTEVSGGKLSRLESVHEYSAHACGGAS